MSAVVSTFPATLGTVVEAIEDLEPPTGDELACDWGNPEACRDDNTQRALFAGVAAKAYAARTSPSGGEPPETVIGDLLGDLMHLCDALGLDFDEALANGRNHYDHELRGEF